MPDPKVSNPVKGGLTTGPIIDPKLPISPGTLTTAPVPLTPSNPTVTTTAPTSSVAVMVPNATGKVTFQLVVTDNLGVQSAPVTATVVIQGPPTAVIAATPAVVTAGGAIELTGQDSSSTGTIASYAFTLVQPTAPIG